MKFTYTFCNRSFREAPRIQASPLQSFTLPVKHRAPPLLAPVSSLSLAVRVTYSRAQQLGVILFFPPSPTGSLPSVASSSLAAMTQKLGCTRA